MRALIDWTFRNRQTGKLTVAQLPNAPLWLFLATAVLRRTSIGGTGRSVVSWIGIVALAWWAVDEIVRGVNPFRRVLGGIGLFAAVSGLVALVR